MQAIIAATTTTTTNSGKNSKIKLAKIVTNFTNSLVYTHI